MLAITHFNSTLVRLAPIFRLIILKVVYHFNSTLVRLALRLWLQRLSENHFNSTLVRLAPGGRRHPPCRFAFQFYISTISTNCFPIVLRQT